MRGRTYTLSDPLGSSSGYYEVIREVTDRCVLEHGGEVDLLVRLRGGTGRGSLLRRFFGSPGRAGSLARSIAPDLARYTADTGHHLRNLSGFDRMDPVLSTREDEYHLYMLEIEVANRVNRKAFKSSSCKMALIAHCLRDFRDNCQAEPGSIESVCRSCESGCFVNQGGAVLQKHGIEPFISTTMDHKRLFSGLKKKHPELGALGIACIPELVLGMRLCEGLKIPAVGIPLDVNRCVRWLGATGESSFSIKELGKLLG